MFDFTGKAKWYAWEKQKGALFVLLFVHLFVVLPNGRTIPVKLRLERAVSADL